MIAESERWYVYSLLKDGRERDELFYDFDEAILRKEEIEQEEHFLVLTLRETETPIGSYKEKWEEHRKEAGNGCFGFVLFCFILSVMSFAIMQYLTGGH